MPVRTLILVLLAVAALSGCGRRGPLEEPSASTGAVSEDAAVPAGAGISPLDPGAPAPSAAAPPPAQQQPAPRRRFLLDFLL
jgi:hypothetical protein